MSLGALLALGAGVGVLALALSKAKAAKPKPKKRGKRATATPAVPAAPAAPPPPASLEQQIAKKKPGTKKGSGKVFGKNDRLGPNFTGREFLTSKVAGPALLDWPIPEPIWNNMLRLVTFTLQPLRNELKVPLMITSGWRPKDFSRNGKDFYTLLQEAGYKPAPDSDHYYGQAAGIYPKGKNAKESTRLGIEAFKRLQANPNVRQVILYLKKNKAGEYVLQHIHVAIKSPSRGALPARNRAFVMIDGKRSEEFKA